MSPLRGVLHTTRGIMSNPWEEFTLYHEGIISVKVDQSTVILRAMSPLRGVLHTTKASCQPPWNSSASSQSFPSGTSAAHHGTAQLPRSLSPAVPLLPTIQQDIFIAAVIRSYDCRCW